MSIRRFIQTFLLLAVLAPVDLDAQVVSVSSAQALDEMEGGLVGPMWPTDFDIFSYPEAMDYGAALANLGDLDGDGIDDLASGAWGHGDGGVRRGAVRVVHVNADGTVDGEQTISSTEGITSVIDLPLGGPDLDNFDFFGRAVSSIGDLDDDGFLDLAVGAQGDDDGGGGRGAVWILFRKANGTIRTTQKISDTAGGFTGILLDGDSFGSDLAFVGDLDDDGVEDLAVGARFDDDGGTSRGAVWVLFLNDDGTVKGHQKISDTAGGFTGALDDNDAFGEGLGVLPDLDADGNAELAVGAPGDDDGGGGRGAVWILFLDDDGTVKSHQKISDTTGGFGGVLSDGGRFGEAVTGLGDLNNDTFPDLAVGVPEDDDCPVGDNLCGAVWILFLNAAGVVTAEQKISVSQGGFAGDVNHIDNFGTGVAGMDDVDADGVPDLAVAAEGDNEGGGGLRRGAVWMLFLNSDGTVKAHQKISAVQGGDPGNLGNDDAFGTAVAAIGDINDDGVDDIAVGTPGEDFLGEDRGGVWIVMLNTDGTVDTDRRITSDFTNLAISAGIPFLPLDDDDGLGRSVTGLGDLDGDGTPDIVVGAPGDDDGGSARGAIWLLYLSDNATVNDYKKISDTEGGFTGVLDDGDEFGFAVANIGDLDGDTVVDLAVGAPGDDDGGDARGAVWLLFMNSDGTVKGHQKISDTAGGFTGIVADFDRLGESVAGLGLFDADAVEDVIVGAPGDDDGASGAGAAWIMTLNADGTVKGDQKISALAGGLSGPLNFESGFGTAVTQLGDFDSDGVTDVVVGEEGGFGTGAAWVLFLNSDGTVKSETVIDMLPMTTLENQDGFGTGIANLGDLNGDGPVDLAVGAPGRDIGGRNRGAAWILNLSDSSLPVELTSFTAVTDGDDVTLRWQTASETNNAGFFLVGTGDWGLATTRWETFGWIEGSGTTSEPRVYRQTVSDLDAGPYAFRLKQVDFDGSVQYSEQIEVFIEAPDGYVLSQVFPNPITDMARLTLTSRRSEPVRVALYDVHGRLLRIIFDDVLESHVPQRLLLRRDGLSAGVYFVGAHGRTTVTTRRIVIMR